MASQVEIMNLALYYLGTSEQIQTLDENSKAANTLSFLFPFCVETTLAESVLWPFATKRLALADLGTPPADWGYRYRHPVDCLRARNIVRADGQDRPVIPYEIAWDESGGRVLLTHEPQAVLRYTARITNPSVFDPEFTESLAWQLAVKAALSLSDSPAVRQETDIGYQRSLIRAHAAVLNEGARSEPTYRSEAERARQ